MAYTFDDAKAEERHTTQYFEMVGNRAIYHLGWTAVAKHKDPWAGSTHGLDDDVWELYDVDEDWTQANDLANDHPDKLAELQRLFLIQAARFNVLPLDIRSGERFNSDIAGRPVLIRGTSPDALSRHEAAQGERRRRPQEQVAHDHGGDRRAEGRRQGRDRRPGRRPTAAGASTRGRTLAYCYNLLGHRPLQGRRRLGAFRPARRRSGPSSPTTAAVSARAARSRCSCRKKKVGSKATSSGRCRSCSRWTRRSTLG